METISSAFDGRLTSCHDIPPKAIIFGRSEGMKGLWQIVERVASARVPLLISGEKGTGKEVLARFIHCCSPGPAAPFLKVSFPIAYGRANGGVAFRVEPQGANGEDGHSGDGDSAQRTCTLFVDEVAEMAPDSQLELLQLIQGCKTYISSGGADIPVTFRVIGTSTHELRSQVAAGTFREDLFSLLSVVTLRLPPLRERKEDIPQLAEYFCRIYSQKFDRQTDAPGARLMGHLQLHDWPGNIRELENAMKRYVVLGTEGVEGMGVPPHQEEVAFQSAVQHALSLKDLSREAVHELERRVILRTLQETQWNRRRTARALNISYRSLLYKIKEAGLLSEESKAAVESSGRRNRKSDHEAA